MKIGKVVFLVLLMSLGLLLGCEDDSDDDTDTDGDDDTDNDTDDDTDNDTDDDTDNPPVRCEGGLSLPDNVFYPEGIAIDDSGNLYVGSIASGEIFKYSDGTGPAEGLVMAGEPFISTVGVAYDFKRSMLWACNSKPDDMSIAYLMGVDVSNGNLIVSHEITSAAITICNDLELDPQGNVYLTDSVSHRILRLPADSALVPNSMEVWSTDSKLQEGLSGGPDLEISVNGIVATDDAVYTASFTPGLMFKIPIQADGTAGSAEIIQFSNDPLVTPDGIEMDDDGSFLVVENALNRVSRVVLDGLTATRTTAFEVAENPSTMVIDKKKGVAWVVQNQSEHFLNGTDPSMPFCIAKVPLP